MSILVLQKTFGENTWKFLPGSEKLIIQLLEKLGVKNTLTSRLFLINPEEKSIVIKKNGLVRKFGLKDGHFVHFNDVYCGVEEKYTPETHMQVAIELPVQMMDQLMIHLMGQLFDLCK